MRFKLDENLPARALSKLFDAGHDAVTVHEEHLCGHADEDVFEAAISEQRTLITLDHDFGNVLRFPPERSWGVVVLELPSGSSLPATLERINELIRVLRNTPIQRELWIVEPGRIRVHSREVED